MKEYPLPLFHGTDRKILAMSYEERDALANICDHIADISYSFLEMKGIRIYGMAPEAQKNKERLSDIWIELCSRGLIPYCARKNNSTLFEYDNIYVTNSLRRAEAYARRNSICGERGAVADCLLAACERFSDFGLSQNTEVRKAIEYFEAFRKEEKKPVVLEFTHVPEEYLTFENGKQIDWDSMESALVSAETSFRLRDGFVLLSQGRIIEID